VPAGRVAALRDAFIATTKDTEFLADATRQKLEIDPTGGAEIQELVTDILSAPPEMMAKARAMLSNK
jgi:hypothetical protein